MKEVKKDGNIMVFPKNKVCNSAKSVLRTQNYVPVAQNTITQIINVITQTIVVQNTQIIIELLEHLQG